MQRSVANAPTENDILKCHGIDALEAIPSPERGTDDECRIESTGPVAFSAND